MYFDVAPMDHVQSFLGSDAEVGQINVGALMITCSCFVGVHIMNTLMV